MILDSGERREFPSGAVRDIADGKGRCDLLPLDVVAMILAPRSANTDSVLDYLGWYVREGNSSELHGAIDLFIQNNYENHTTAMLELSKHYEEGAKKYSDRNWEKGQFIHCFIDSGVRHYLKHLRGDTDERHDLAFMWNIMGAIWTIRHRPELDDVEHAFADKEATP